jgi:hypothetical protein
MVAAFRCSQPAARDPSASVFARRNPSFEGVESGGAPAYSETNPI